MDILLSTEISVSLFQVVALLVLSTVALLYGMTRIALFINYIFVMYWAYLANMDKIYDAQFRSLSGMSNYYVMFGILIGLLASAALLVGQD